MVWNDQAYDHLVYDEEQKDLVLSFVESHGNVRHQVDDVIMGKGESLICQKADGCLGGSVLTPDLRIGPDCALERPPRNGQDSDCRSE